MTNDPACPFCRIVRDGETAFIIYEDAASIAFLDREPAAEGHTLVVPRVHSRNLFDIDPHVASALLASAARVARVLNAALHPDGLTMIQTNEAAGWQSVFHFHLHLIPRWVDDTLAPPWESGPVADDSLARVRSRILRAIDPRAFEG